MRHAFCRSKSRACRDWLLCRALGVMRWNVPRRFSLEWWLWLTSGAFTFGFLTFIVLFLLGIFTNLLVLISVVIAASLVGDLLMAVSFEIIAPTKVTLGPGERARNDQSISELATIESGFHDSAIGRVRVRGEIWTAQDISGTKRSLNVGDKMQVVGREGLVLRVQPEQ